MQQIKAVTYGTGLPEFNSKLKQKYVKQSRLFIYEESGASSHRVQFAEQSGLLCQNYATKRETFHNI